MQVGPVLEAEFWTMDKVQKPGNSEILSVTNHRENPLDSTLSLCSCLNVRDQRI
jgi:hypothetical protein